MPTALDITFDWDPDLTESSNQIFVPHDDASAAIHGLIHTDLVTPSKSSSTINGSLKNFDINLFPGFALISVTFNEISFSAANGQKPNVNVDIQTVNFEGVLQFVQTLEQFLSAAGLGGLSIDIEPTQVMASLTVALPDIGVGVLSLTNLSFSSSLTIPFTGSPARIRFAFCSQDSPFNVSVMFLGGGGFFGLALGMDGLEKVEASVEFGAEASIDLGIASGSIEIEAGIYFSLTLTGSQQDIDLTGYVRMGGEVSVMGIISISITCYIALSYENNNGASSVTGEASITIAVSLLFFSISASIGVRKTFGGGSDPTFAQAIPNQGVWQQYTNAFAPIGA